MIENIMEKLKILGFKEINNKLIYTSPNGYQIEIDKSKENLPINYGNEIKVHNRSTSNLTKAENLVVLECVIRLLNKGYLPKNIELEKDWPLGHGEKGRLDILLNDPEGKAYALIECKTWGEEYSKERNKMLEDGGQLFSYFVQERSTKMLYLYSSKIGSSVHVYTEYVDCAKLDGSNIDELFKSWDRSFISNGIFADDATIYDNSYRNIVKRDLQELDADNAKGVFYGFQDILRQHAVSDKSNAFNKIFNLFVCKIIDEDSKRDNQELDFQWKYDDTYSDLLDRLQKLYKAGLKKYLGIEINDTFFSALSEFSFIDVFDEISFNKNGQILKEVVELLQNYQIKYTGKHQFLGDFFESLLTTGIKQESGQFFTPIPLARFILRSLPIEKIIENKINDGEVDVLPYVIDYACGSGHFLTEAMDEIQQIMNRIDETKLIGRARSKFLSMKNDFLWAREFVHGIEKDYRLAKTTKIATFLNGDGDANIINGDGLDDFYNSRTYKGRLKNDIPNKNNSKFDLVISNPPYSIENFKKHIVNGKDNFELYNKITYQSSEIECLFLERASQLLGNGGCAGLIFPLSLLNSTKTIYNYARKKMLLDFEIIGLVELGSKTFVATPTATVIVFMRKRPENTVLTLLQKLYDYFVKGNSCEEIDTWINFYLEDFPYEIGYFKQIFENDPYFKGENNLIIELHDEILKLLIYGLNSNKKTVISFSGDSTQKQQHYLGYRFSTSRRKEGIHLLEDEKGLIDTMLYDPVNVENDKKVSTHIRNNFLGIYSNIPDELKETTRLIDTIKLINDDLTLSNPSQFFIMDDEEAVYSYSKYGDFIDELDCDDVTIDKWVNEGILTLISGLVYPKTAEVPYKTDKPILTATNISLENSSLTFQKVRYLKNDYNIPSQLIPKKDDIVISVASGSLKHLGKVAYVTDDVKGYIGGFLNILRTTNSVYSKVLYYNLLSKRFRAFVAQLRDQNINNLTSTQLKKFVLKVPKDLDTFMELCTEKEN